MDGPAAVHDEGQGGLNISDVVEIELDRAPRIGADITRKRLNAKP
jgi:hypothetical protein